VGGLFAFGGLRGGIASHGLRAVAFALIAVAISVAVVPRAALFVTAAGAPDFDHRGLGGGFRCSSSGFGKGRFCGGSFCGRGFAGGSLRRGRLDRRFSGNRFRRSFGGRRFRDWLSLGRSGGLGVHRSRRRQHIVISRRRNVQFRQQCCRRRRIAGNFLRDRFHRQRLGDHLHLLDRLFGERRAAIHAVAERAEDRGKVFAGRSRKRGHRLSHHKAAAV